MTDTTDSAAVTVSVEDLGGIRSCQVTLDRGVTVLTGRNATNRTSLLRALGAGLGGSTADLRADADRGSVTLDVDGTEYTRTFERADGAVRVGGDPYVDDGTVVDHYCCLLAGNPARDAVERGDGDALREYVMAPLDTDAVEATVERARREIRSLEDDLAEAERERDRVADLERRLEERRSTLEAVQSELEEVRAAIETFEADVDAAKEAEAVVEELSDAREEYERVRGRLETQRNALASLRTEREAVAADLESTEAPADEREALQADLERLQRRERDLETTVNNLLSIVEFNEGLLDGEAVPAVAADGDVAADLDPAGRTVECWTCGTRVERSAIDDRLADLRDVVDEKRRERNRLRSEIDDVRAALREVRSAARERQELEAELEDIDAEIDDRETRIERLEGQVADLEDRIDDLESRAAESDDLRDDDLLERYRRRSELEYERGQLEEGIDSLEADLEAARGAAERVEDVEAELADRRAELETARSRIDDLERAAVETFNEHVAAVLDLLDYENVERVWIERTRDGDDATPVPESSFVLHVVRATADGAVFEDTVAHLSESEREVVGLVVALAGYLVHDVHETCPFLLLDSLEAVDADRIAALVDYVADFVPFLVVALLPEDAAALPDEYERIAMGEAPA